MKLFVYDHCPYCIKARMIFGLKNVDFELVILANDDEETPISMINQKMVPILEKEDGGFMPESLDIIDYIDSNYGNERLVHVKPNEEISNWNFNCHDYLYELCMPRWAKANLEEFQTDSAINYFTKKKESFIGSFLDNMENSDKLISTANKHLEDLDSILANSNEINAGDKIALDYINLFTNLRCLSIVKGLKYPKNVEKYRQKLAKISKIPLHDNLSI